MAHDPCNLADNRNIAACRECQERYDVEHTYCIVRVLSASFGKLFQFHDLVANSTFHLRLVASRAADASWIIPSLVSFTPDVASIFVELLVRETQLYEVLFAVSAFHPVVDD